MNVSKRTRWPLLLATLASLAASTVSAQQATRSRPVNSRLAQAPTPITSESPPPAPVPDSQGAPPPDSANAGGQPWTDDGSGWDDSDSGNGVCGNSCRPGLLSSYFNNCGCYQSGIVYGGADYLYFKTHMSAAEAFDQRVSTTNSSVSPSVTTTTDTAVPFQFNYQSGFRVFAGIRLVPCGGDIQFTYWRLGSSAAVTSGAASPFTNPATAYIGLLGYGTADTGQFISAYTNVAFNIFDGDFAKCLSFGGPRGPCDCCPCPVWDLRFSAGVRGVNYTRNVNEFMAPTAAATGANATINSQFNGAGPRLGIQGRRYFGQNGHFSIFARGGMALLLGDYTEHRTIAVTSATGSIPTLSIATANATYARMVPVTDIEIGASWQVCPCVFLSGGWFFQCWWDLNGSNQVQGSAPVDFPTLDTANITALEGLFLRAEMFF